MQNKVLIVDGDTRSLRLLEVSLKQVGYRVGTATSGVDALGQLEVELPELVLADSNIGEVDGFALYARLQQRPEWAHLPFILILDGDNPAEKLRAVQLGVSDFLNRPLFLKEALSRVELLLEKQAQRGERAPGQAPTSGRARFAGALSGTALLDLLQTMELGRKSGIAYCVSGRGQRAAIYFADGAVVDAELGSLRGVEAFYRVLTFQGGEYRVELLTVVRVPRIELGSAALLMEAMRYLEEWNRLCAALPPLTAPLGGAAGALRPESLPAELREMLRRFDGRRSVLDVLELLDEEAVPPHDALARLGVVAKLYAARLLTPAVRPISGEPRAPVPTPIAVPRLTPSVPPRLTPPPLPRLTPPPLPRMTPPPLVGGRAAVLAGLGRPTPVALPRAVVKTPAPISDSGTLTLPEDLLITLVPGEPGMPASRTGRQRTTDAGSSDESLTPLPPPFPPVARPTPVAQPVVSHLTQTLPPAPALPENPPVLPVSAARMTPPPLPVTRRTPPIPLAVLPAVPFEPARARLTPPPLPDSRELSVTPVVPVVAIRPPMPSASEPGRARLTPPPRPELREPRVTPILSEAATHDAPSAEPQALRLTPANLEAEGAGATPEISEDALAWLAPLSSMEESEPASAAWTATPAEPLPMHELPAPRPERPAAGMTLELGEDDVEAAAPTLLSLAQARPTPVGPIEIVDPEPAAAEPQAARGEDSGLNVPMGGASSPGNNLARLAQRLAATRQPLPFAAPPLPSLSMVAASLEPGPAGRALPAASEPGAATAAASQSWIGSLPELEPISIPEFELAIEHSAPSWGPGEPPASAAPSSELRANKTLPVHLRGPNKTAPTEREQEAVHISVPVPLPAEAASISLPPIEVDAPPKPLLLPVPPPAPRPRQRWGKVVAWAVAATALFSLGVGLYWVRQELDRGITVPLTQRAEAPLPAPQGAGSPVAGQAEAVQAPPAAAEKSVAKSEPALADPIATPPASENPSAAAPAAPLQAPATEPQPVASKEDSQAAAVGAPGAAASSGSPAAANEAPSSSPPPSGEFAALIGRAQAFERRGALTQAYHAVRAAQRLQPRRAEVFALLAQLSLDEGSADKAAGLAKRALNLNKNSADAYLVLGTVEQARSHPAKARVYFKKYLALAPSGDRAVEVRAVLRLSHH